jgi:ring-1,2-phenylacetyl-CoA epoxidase subunit PaaC
VSQSASSADGLRERAWRAAAQVVDPEIPVLTILDLGVLRGIEAKSEKESAYHLRHACQWVIRLGDGTAESHARAQAAVNDLWSFTGDLFEADPGERGLIEQGVAVDPARLRGVWSETIVGVPSRMDASR